MQRTILSPTLRAYFAGRTIEPIGYVGGRPVYPIAGGAEDDEPTPGDDKPGAGTDEKPASRDGKGYPDNTRPDDMTPEQQAAYWRSRSQTHEDRNRDLLRITGGKYGDALRADMTDLEQLRDGARSDGERAVAEAERTARADERGKWATKLAAAEFRAALGHVDGERRDQIIEGLNLSNYITDDGDVDTAKVQSYAATIAPKSAKEEGKREHDFGAGRRSDGSAKAGSVAAVMEERRKSREKSTA